MANKVASTVLSDKRCTSCNKPLKQNLVTMNANANKCWCCYNVAKGKLKMHIRKGKGTELEHEVIIDFVKKQKEYINTYRV